MAIIALGIVAAGSAAAGYYAYRRNKNASAEDKEVYLDAKRA